MQALVKLASIQPEFQLDIAGSQIRGDKCDSQPSKKIRLRAAQFLISRSCHINFCSETDALLTISAAAMTLSPQSKFLGIEIFETIKITTSHKQYFKYG
jgi:hypothetical protein